MPVSARKTTTTRRMLNNDDVLFQIAVRDLARCVCALPFSGFALCVAWALAFHFEGATRTHCGVPNYLPSISAAIGDFTPERYIWRFCIALHCFPRFIVAIAYKNYYLSSPLRPIQSNEQSVYWIACWFVALLHIAENLSLVLLTVVSSTERKDVHECCFILFMAFSLCYMLATLYVFNLSGRRRSSSLGEQSYQYKTVLFGVNISAFLASVYFFFRHNWYCEPGVYTLFASCEYVVVVTNILFHWSVSLDFHDKFLQVASLPSADWKAT